MEVKKISGTASLECFPLGMLRLRQRLETVKNHPLPFVSWLPFRHVKLALPLKPITTTTSATIVTSISAVCPCEKTTAQQGRSTIDFGALEFEAIGLDMAYPGAVTYVEVAVFESSHFSELGFDVPGAAVR